MSADTLQAGATAPRSWPVLYLAVGAAVGAGVIALYAAVDWASRWLGSGLAGMRAAGADATGRPWLWQQPLHAWATPLVVGGGALLATLLVKRLAPGAGGHGTDAAIDAVHVDPGGIPASVSVVKICASALLLGSGGSGGTEGPITHISASLGSALCRRFRVPERHAWIVVTAALAAGVGALFKAPLAGAVLGVEILYVSDLTAEVLLPAALASAVAYAECGLVYGFGPVFGQVPVSVHPLRDLPLALALGIPAGAAARLYVTCFHRVAARFRRLTRVPALWRPAAGGLLVGLLGVALPAVLGTGYGDVPVFLSGSLLSRLSWWVVLALPFAKILATSLSIGSGGSGGVFGPALIIGCATGAAAWRLLAAAGLGPAAPAVFVIVCGAACLGAAVHAPLAVALMAAELFGHAALTLPCLLAALVARLVVGREQLYLSQRLRRDVALPAQNPQPHLREETTMESPPPQTGSRTALANSPGADAPSASLPLRKSTCTVMKFGGTSLGDPDRIRNAARRVAHEVRSGRQVAVVVSAMGRTTDDLVSLATQVARHRPARELDLLMSSGECVSAALLVMALADLSCPATALTGGQAGVRTDASFGNAQVRSVNPEPVGRVLDDGRIAVITGFQGATARHEVTTLGRGGSDASAALIAASLGVEVCEIFTDVDGVFTADPREDPAAVLIPEISYADMRDIARAGAQVVQERAVEVAESAGVVLHVRSSFHHRTGTLVGDPTATARIAEQLRARTAALAPVGA